MQDPNDAFFALRPKLSWRAWVIRVLALVIAMAISLCFLAYNFAIVTSPTYSGLPVKLFWIVANTVLQIIMLIPLWRLWMLRQWPCVVLMMILFWSVFLLIVMLVAAQVWALSVLILVVFLFWMLVEEWPHLKSGF